MPHQVITPRTPCFLIALRPKRSAKGTDWFWIASTTQSPPEYVAWQIEIARQDGAGSARLKAAIKEILVTRREVWFDLIEQRIPYAEIKERKAEAIARYWREGYPLRNSEVDKLERAKATAALGTVRAESAERERPDKDSAAQLVGLRAVGDEKIFWLGACLTTPQEYLARWVGRVREGSGRVSPAMTVAIKDVLDAGLEIEAVPVGAVFRYGAVKERKYDEIMRLVGEGHPLRNPEAVRAPEMAKRGLHERDKELYRWPKSPEGCLNIFVEEEWIEGEEPRAVRVGATKNTAGERNSSISFTTLAHPYTAEAKRVRDQKERGARRRLRLLEVHPRAGIAERKKEWARRLGLT